MPPRRNWDPFRLLSILIILLGMVILIVAVVLYYVLPSHLASPEIFGAGMALTIGGSARGMLGWIIGGFPQYEPPPLELPEPRDPRERTRHIEERERP